MTTSKVQLGNYDELWNGYVFHAYPTTTGLLVEWYFVDCRQSLCVRNMSYHPQPREHVSLFYSDDYFAMKLQWKTMKDVQKNNFVQFRDRESLIGEL